MITLGNIIIFGELPLVYMFLPCVSTTDPYGVFTLPDTQADTETDKNAL